MQAASGRGNGEDCIGKGGCKGLQKRFHRAQRGQHSVAIWARKEVCAKAEAGIGGGGFISVNPSVMNILDIFLGVTPCCSLEMCKNKQFCKFGHASALRGVGDN